MKLAQNSQLKQARQKARRSVQPTKRWKPGFALVVTLMTLSLLIVLVLALTTLAQSDTRTAAHARAQAVAEHNALMGLKKAIGELQLSLGPDQRISANASILNDTVGNSGIANPHWLGSWNSWRAGGGEYENYIDANSDHSTIINGRRGDPTSASMHPTYRPKREDHFRNWLVSLTREEAERINTPIDLVLNGSTQPDPGMNAVCLVGEGTLGEGSDASDYVKARLINIYDEQEGFLEGRYGWWVGDESQKARIMGDPYRNTDPSVDLGDALFRQQSPGSTGTLVVNGLENIPDDRKLTGLQSLQTINLVNGINGKPSENFHHITSESSSLFSDVREGGLKRDLSILLEQPINLGDTGDEFMLYRFGDKRVPIQDLSTYYQLYDNDPDWQRDRRGGLIHDGNGVRIETPNFGGVADADREKYLREYSSIYRNPVPIKVEFLLAMTSKRITDAERAALNNGKDPSHPDWLRAEDTHRLLLGVMPTVTLWNPYNVPVHMNHGQRFVMNTPPFGLRWVKSRDGLQFVNQYFNINYAQDQPGSDGRATRERPLVIHFAFAQSQPIVFEPGEVKIFSVPPGSQSQLDDADNHDRTYTATFRPVEPINMYDPYGFYTLRKPATSGIHVRRADGSSYGTGDGHVYRFGGNALNLVFGANDTIAVDLLVEGADRGGRRNRPPLGCRTAQMNEVFGAGFHFHLMDDDFAPTDANRFHFRHYNLISRYGGPTNVDATQNCDFNRALMNHGMPGKADRLNLPPRLGRDIIAVGNENEMLGFLQFSMKAGCELLEGQQAGYGSGRRNTSRPFLHGSTILAPFMDRFDASSVYNYGWEWQMDGISDVDDSSIQDKPGTGNGFFGGGYTEEAGSTHVVQQYLPVAPPMSIAALSSAHLGGYSLADAPSAMGKNDLVHYKGENGGIYRGGPPNAFYQTTAHGQGGLAPNTMQAIGNSYAHPNIPADKAHTTWTRFYDSDLLPTEEPFVDHSYLANKALWDEFTFSSITPQRSEIPLFAEGDRSAKEVAESFFFNGAPLPNSRIKPITRNMDSEKLDALFSNPDDLVDQISSHLMMEGGFNINSTSVEAWTIFLSSLRGKAVASLDANGQVQSQTLEGVPVGPGDIPAGTSIQSSDITPGESNIPDDQWRAWRELSDYEISELATAIVKQVKLRGPFLSLSEFINRRLDASNLELSKKGALQAALDDPEVSINSGFRSGTDSNPSRREFSSLEIDYIFDPIPPTIDEPVSLQPAFREALEGPIAYGSTPYVDQADILRHLGSQITPRGDTFVIRTYGDSIGPDGEIDARAWCEAVVQRMPEYVDDSDDAHLSYKDLPDDSIANRRFGRKLEVISFRWLHPSEL